MGQGVVEQAGRERGGRLEAGNREVQDADRRRQRLGRHVPDEEMTRAGRVQGGDAVGDRLCCRLQDERSADRIRRLAERGRESVAQVVAADLDHIERAWVARRRRSSAGTTRSAARDSDGSPASADAAGSVVTRPRRRNREIHCMRVRARERRLRVRPTWKRAASCSIHVSPLVKWWPPIAYGALGTSNSFRPKSGGVALAWMKANALPGSERLSPKTTSGRSLLLARRRRRWYEEEGQAAGQNAGRRTRCRVRGRGVCDIGATLWVSAGYGQGWIERRAHIVCRSATIG